MDSDRDARTEVSEGEGDLRQLLEWTIYRTTRRPTMANVRNLFCLLKTQRRCAKNLR